VKLALIGVGLLGGSFARAALGCGEVDRVIGYDVDAQALAAAQAIGAIHEAAPSAAAAVRGADLVMLAVPVGAMAESMTAIAPDLGADAIVTDVGSTKASVIAAARRSLGPAAGRFVPAHPIAGGETPGVRASDPGLFRKRLCITTPEPDTDAAALARVEALWRALGSRVERMAAADHDRVFAAVSHLPHLLAFALVAHIAGEADADGMLARAGAGFRDVTRIAASSPRIWRDVCLANREALAAELDGYRALLAELRAALDAADGERLEAVFRTAAECRRAHATHLDAD
jgi:prephenate dehydrogenase